MNGWFKFHRKIFDNPVCNKDSEYFYVWCWILANAKYEDGERELFKNEDKVLHKGQLITTTKKISEKLNVSESKVNRILKKLEIERQIERQTSTKNTLISVVNWEQYQSDEKQNEKQMTNQCKTSEKQMTDERQTSEEQMKNERQTDDKPSYYIKKERIKEDKELKENKKTEEKGKKENKNTMCKADALALFEQLWQLYPVKKGKGQVSLAAKQRLLKVGYEEITRAIDRYKAELEKDSDWRKPQNGSTFFNSGYVDYLDSNYEEGGDSTGRIGSGDTADKKRDAYADEWNRLLSE